MRWRQDFVAEVSQSLQQLGLRACPVCGSSDSLGVGHFPLFLVDGGPPPGAEDVPLGKDRDHDITFAIRIECSTCGHLMLFNAEKYRASDEAIMVRELPEEESRMGELPCPGIAGVLVGRARHRGRGSAVVRRARRLLCSVIPYAAASAMWWPG
jgi:hypothetical protein